MSCEPGSAKLNITIIGSLNVDFITRAARVPSAGETLHGTSFEVKWGGKGANQAVAVGRLTRENADDENATANVKMVGMVGDDVYGSQMVEALKKSGIDTAAISIRKGEMTGIASIWVDETDGENRILVVGGANDHLQKVDYPTSFTSQPTFDGYGDIAIFQLENPLDVVLHRIKAAHDKRAMVIFNPAPASPLNPDVYSSVAVLMVNESEAETLSDIHLLRNQEDLDRAAQFFIAKGVKVVVITLGERGAYCRTTNGSGKLHPARRVNVVDSTGAGDTFVGAFAAFMSRPNVRKTWIGRDELDPSIAHQAVEFATLASSIAVQNAGAQDAIPWLSAVPIGSAEGDSSA